MGVLDRGATCLEPGVGDERPLESFEAYLGAVDDREAHAAPFAEDDRGANAEAIRPPWPPAEAALELSPWLQAGDRPSGLRG